MITEQEHINNLVSHAYMREHEIYQYQNNIDNYTIALTGLPNDEFPNHLSQYKNVLSQDLPFSLNDEDVEIITKYQYRDRLKSLLRSEKTEQNKSRLLLESIKLQLNALNVNYSDALSAKKVEMEALQNQQT